MKYFRELTEKQQEQVLDNLQDLPLFSAFREDARQLLMTSDVYLFDEKLRMIVKWEKGEEDADDT